MANNVFANTREISCKAADGKSICAFPDVCFTPPQTPATPPGVPIPYPNTGLSSDCTDGSSTVKISGQAVMLKNKSYFKRSTGNEAGCAPKKGVMTSKNMGKVYFTMWSMDVKVEGENVVRHLDMTTHNHGSNPNSPPWPYQDAINMDEEGHPCRKMAQAIKADCGGKTDYGEPCCKARRCLLMPYKPNCCCTAESGENAEKMTPHHLVPSYHFVAKEDRGKQDPVTLYDDRDAPCLCVVGETHARSEEHGQVGTLYTQLRNDWRKANGGQPVTLAVATSLGAQSAVEAADIPEGTEGCDQACLAKQLEKGHNDMKLNIKPDDPLPQQTHRRKK